MKNLLAKIIAPLTPALLAAASASPAPNFTAHNQDGKEIRLSDHKGMYVLLYFYPKDDTPGCTKEACEFRDRYSEIKKLNTVIYGISRQDGESHKKFIAKHKLPFDLLVDHEGKIGESFGVGSIPVVGAIFGLSKRQSVLIGPDGNILKFYETVDPKGHVEEVIKDIQNASAKK